TGTTSFNGVSGSGIGGALSVTTNNVTLATSDMVTVGAVDIVVQNAISFGDNAGLNAGSSTIMLAANQDGSGSQGMTQNSSAVIRTTNGTDHAIQIIVGGSGSANVSLLQAGTVTGTIQITVGGAIVDNRTGEDP